MTNSYKFDANKRLGWEQIWQSNNIPPCYKSTAAPNDMVIEWMKTVSPGGTILDVGCGAGRHVLYLGRHGFQVAGVDISPSGVKMAREACAEQGIVFDGQVSDMATLPWPDNFFDAALSTSTIHHQMRARITQTLTEVRRVLKPGGVLLVDLPNTDTIMYETLRDLVLAGQITEVEPNTFVDERPDTADTDGFLPHHFCDEADIRDLLLRGFEILKLSADLQKVETKRGLGKVGRWVAWVRKPLNDKN